MKKILISSLFLTVVLGFGAGALGYQRKPKSAWSNGCCTTSTDCSDDLVCKKGPKGWGPCSTTKKLYCAGEGEKIGKEDKAKKVGKEGY